MNIHKCLRCSHDWASRGSTEKPKYCPSCKSKYWNTERVRNPEAYNSIRTKNIIKEAREHPWASKRVIRKIVKDHEREAEAMA